MELSPHTAQGAQPQAVAPVERLSVGAGTSLKLPSTWRLWSTTGSSFCPALFPQVPVPSLQHSMFMSVNWKQWNPVPKKGIKSKTYSYHQHSTEHTTPIPVINIDFLKDNQSPNTLPEWLTTSSLGSQLTLDSSYSKLQTRCSLLPLAFVPPFLHQSSLPTLCWNCWTNPLGFRLDVASSRKPCLITSHPQSYALTSVTGLLYLSLPIYLFWRRQWHPTPVLLPGKSHGWRSLVGCSPWSRGELDMTERLPFHFSLSCVGEGNGNPLQCSCLENPRDRGAWWAAVYGVAQSWTWLKWLSSSSSSRTL